MICNYKIQCSRCQCEFEVDVELKKSKTYYPVTCPKCKKNIKIRVAKDDQAKSLPSSKSTLMRDKTTADEPSPETDNIVFKCVRQVPKHKQVSKIIRPPQRDKQIFLDEASDSTRGLEVTPSAEDASTHEEVRPYKGTGIDIPEPPLYSPRSSGWRIKSPHRQQQRSDVIDIERESRFDHRISPRYFPMKPGDQLPETETFKKESRLKNYFKNPEKRLYLAIILLIIVFFLGLIHGAMSLHWGQSEPINSENIELTAVDIDGTVIDFSTGRPISNCRVTVVDTGQSDLTNSDGYYYIPNVEIGDKEITTEVSGYAKVIKKITVASEQPANFNFELKPGVSVVTIDETISTIEKSENKINIFAVIILLLACFAILAIFLIRFRNMFKICAFSAFLSALSFGMGFGLALGLLAFVLIILSSSVFTNNKELKDEELNDKKRDRLKHKSKPYRRKIKQKNKPTKLKNL